MLDSLDAIQFLSLLTGSLTELGQSIAKTKKVNKSVVCADDRANRIVTALKVALSKLDADYRMPCLILIADEPLADKQALLAGQMEGQ